MCEWTATWLPTKEIEKASLLPLIWFISKGNMLQAERFKFKELFIVTRPVVAWR